MDSCINRWTTHHNNVKTPIRAFSSSIVFIRIIC
jgi:hypothetical protein